MNIYLAVEQPSKGIERVRDALIKYSPHNIQFVADERDADTVILHVIGRRDHVAKRVKKIVASGKSYVIIQYCLRSTMRPNTRDWIDIWNGAKLVWSYYDLPELCSEDGLSDKDIRFLFYHSPLGVESGTFYNLGQSNNTYVVVTSGLHALSEGVKECAIASERTGKKMFHLGHDLRRGDHITEMSGINDAFLAWIYSQSAYVSGLRRTEGFELPCAEGLLCGARPIMFDRPHYRKWFDGFAEFIPESDRNTVIRNLIRLFRKVPETVSYNERVRAVKLFNWNTIIPDVYKRIV